MLADLVPGINHYRIILASGSPRRRELLAQIGVKADVIPSKFPEDLDKSEFDSPGEYCLENSRQKALEVFERIKGSFKLGGPAIIIGSDTVVVNDTKILEKPQSPENAMEMLTTLQGKSHTVISSIVLLVVNENDQPPKFIGEIEKTLVTFDEISAGALKTYIKTKDPLDKAGSYGIQGPAAIFIKEIKGDYYNVVGFPLNLFYRLMKIAASSF